MLEAPDGSGSCWWWGRSGPEFCFQFCDFGGEGRVFLHKSRVIVVFRSWWGGFCCSFELLGTVEQIFDDLLNCNCLKFCLAHLRVLCRLCSAGDGWPLCPGSGGLFGGVERMAVSQPPLKGVVSPPWLLTLGVLSYWCKIDC